METRPRVHLVGSSDAVQAVGAVLSETATRGEADLAAVSDVARDRRADVIITDIDWFAEAVDALWLRERLREMLGAAAWEPTTPPAAATERIPVELPGRVRLVP